MGKKLVARIEAAGRAGPARRASSATCGSTARLRANERDAAAEGSARRLSGASRRSRRCSPRARSQRRRCRGPAPETWSVFQRARASYHAGRSGDFYVVLKRDVTPIADTSRYVATHGSAWDYDRRVPILFWRPGRDGRDGRAVDRDDRYHADAGEHDRASGAGRLGRRPLPGRGSRSCLPVTAKHLKTRGFSFIQLFRHDYPIRSWGRARACPLERVGDVEAGSRHRAAASVALSGCVQTRQFADVAVHAAERAITNCSCCGPT